MEKETGAFAPAITELITAAEPLKGPAARREKPFAGNAMLLDEVFLLSLSDLAGGGYSSIE